MKTFKRHRTHEQLKRACAKRGWSFLDDKYQEGSDRISFEFYYRGRRAWVVYSVCNGSAIGEFGTLQDWERATLEWFSTNSDKHEDAPWFQSLLRFLYVGHSRQVAASSH